MRVAILGLLALMVGGATIFFAKEWLATERASTAQSQPAPIPTTQVLVATVDMAPGHFVKPDDLRWQPWPKDSIVPSYILESDDAMDDLSGTVVRTMIGSGEPVTENRLVRPGDRGFLAAVLLPGMRAVSVPVNETSGIAGLIYPGDHVDVILTHAVQQASAVGIQTRQVSETVLTNVRVLAIDQNVSLQGPTGAVADTATLEVSPQQAEKVSVMMQIGRLSLSLRSLAEVSSPASPDNTHTVTMDTDVSSLIERPAQEAEAGPPPPEPAPQVTIVRGGQSTIVQQAAPPSATPPTVTPSGDAESGEAPSPEANLRLN